MYCKDFLDMFWNYLEFYPDIDEEGYDGTHDGGIKGLNANAPKEAKEAYEEYLRIEKQAKEQGYKI